MTLAVAAGLVLMAPIVAGAGLLGWQILTYLMDGVWNSVSVVDILAHLDVRWAEQPSTWLGLHSLLERVPASAAAIVLGLSLYGLVINGLNAR